MCSKLIEGVSGKVAVDVAGFLFAVSTAGFLKLSVTPEGIGYHMFVTQSVRATV